MRILLVDDNPGDRCLVKRMLQLEAKCDVREADNGVAALDLLTRQRFDLMLIDLQMPVMDGLETLHALRTLPEYRTLPIIVMTGTSDRDVVRSALDLGVSDYLVKPVNRDRLSQSIARLHEGEGERAGGRPVLCDVPVLVADGDPQFRQWVVDCLRGHYPVLPAESGLQALKVFREAVQRPRVVYIGTALGAINADLLARKLRLLPGAQDSHLIAVVSDVEARSGPTPPDMVDILSRSAEPHQLIDQLARLLRPSSPYRRFAELAPTAKMMLGAVIERYFRVVLGMEMEQVLVSPTDQASATVRARVRMFLREEHVPLELVLGTSEGTARMIASRLFTRDAEHIDMSQVLDALAEVVFLMGARLTSGLLDRDVAVRCGLPERFHSEHATPEPVVQRGEGLVLRFDALDRDASFRVVLTTASEQTVAGRASDVTSDSDTSDSDTSDDNSGPLAESA